MENISQPLVKISVSECRYFYGKNMIHNLSDHTLTGNEFSVLTRGLSFTIHTNHSPKTHQVQQSMIHVLSEYIHSQHIIDKATKEFLLLPKIPAHLYGLPKIHKPGCSLPLLFLGIMIQLTISLPTSPISSIPYLAASYHT